KMKIKTPSIEFIQNAEEYIICDFLIYKDKNPEMFKSDGEINKSKLRKLQIIS
ncbi:unnamed protein product, partial [marine sediment metagenome]